MSTVLLVTWDGGGNVPPALGVAAELIARGNDVTILGHPRQRGAIEAIGASALALEHTAAWDPALARGAARFAGAYLGLFTSRGIGVDTAAAIDRVRPDAVMVDALLPSATDAALASGRPTVVLVHTVLAALLDMARGPIGTVSALKGFSMARGLARAPSLVVASPDALVVDPAPANAVHVGPVFGPGSPAPAAADASSTRVLVSLSTIHYTGMPRVLQSLVDAFRDLPVEAIVTTGPTIDPRTITAPPNVTVHRSIPHREILPEIGLVIGHGGHGTATTALAAGVPVLVRPMSRRADHLQVAAGLEYAGVGSRLDLRNRPAEHAAIIARSLADESQRARARALGELIRAGDGASIAADVVERATAPDDGS